MTLVIEHVAGRASVQDLGRPGLASAGVPTGGAADALMMRLVNRAVGNSEDAAGIELVAGSMSLRAGSNCTVCVSAGERAFEAFEVASGQTLHVAPDVGLCRAYLAVAGGIDVPVVLGSRSTLASAGFGGLHGALLRRGDTIPVGAPAKRPRAVSRALCAMALFAARRRVLRVVTEGAEAPLPAGLLRVSPASDRVGVRLERHGSAPTPEPLEHSRGVLYGTIQMPSANELVILGPDGPTTGGYPTVGTVIAADLPAVGQLVPGQWLRLDAISREEAVDLLTSRESSLAGRL